MESITSTAATQRIGHPSPPKKGSNKNESSSSSSSLVVRDKDDTKDTNQTNASPMAPSLFGMPSKSNYHSSTGFGK